MNNEDAQAIKHAVAAGIRASCNRYEKREWLPYDGWNDAAPAAPVCPHCGTPWTWYQRRGYDKHPCEAWRTERATGHRSASTGHLSNVTEALAAGATVTMHGQGGGGGSTGKL